MRQRAADQREWRDQRGGFRVPLAGTPGPGVLRTAVQGVLTKRHILKNPIVTIRHFGLGVFIEVLRAPANSTFLEIVARHEFKQRRSRQLKQAHKLERLTSRLQASALKMRTFDVISFERATAFSVDAQRLRGGELKQIIDTDPLMTRFKGLLSALTAKDGPIRAALGTLSPTELIAVEARVLKQTEKRLNNEVDQTMQQVLTQLDVVRAHMSHLFHALPEATRAELLGRMSDDARSVLIDSSGAATPRPA